jgi:hypothetical protein
LAVAAETTPVPVRRCPWCSAELPAGALSVCPSCGDALPLEDGAPPALDGGQPADPGQPVDVPLDPSATPDDRYDDLGPPPPDVREEMERLASGEDSFEPAPRPDAGARQDPRLPR